MPKAKGHHRGNKLSAVAIRNIERACAAGTCGAGGVKPGLHSDGHNLYLQVSSFGTLSWLFRYEGKSVGLGPLHVVNVAEARKRAAALNLLRRDGVDPREHKRARQAKAKIDAAKAVTFKACAESYIAANRAGWRSSKHAAEWTASLATHIFPVFGDLSVAAIDVPLVVKALEPIWTTRTETASRLRGRIELILDYARACGYRDGPNPAIWKGGLKAILPAPSKVARVQHHAALAVDAMPQFMSELRAKESTAARALEFTVLVAARLGEMLGARWSEIDLAKKVWMIDGARMKSGRPHTVPLSSRAVQILEGLPRIGERVFPVSAMTAQRLMGSMRPGVTIHGFRSTFRDFAGDRTTVPREIAEAALAHAVGDKVERSYRRGDALEQRRALMEQWARFCEAPPAERDNVVAIGARTA
jgi:integrase